ncbi:MAG: HAD-IA family hydrolase [Proteobacteria bacterium]|nr:HAD-IA family hydrolase [Pseudomonadota bacterium]
MKMKDYKHYLFDADGTLIDTVELICRSFEYTCRKYGGIDIDRDRVIETMGLPLYRQIELFLGKMPESRKKEILEDFKEYQLSIYNDLLGIFPEVEETLRTLKNSGKNLAIVTSRKKETATLYLKHVGILPLFDAVVTPEMTDTHKPDPAPALKALELLDGSAENSLFIGDASFDILCGQKASMDTAFVAWSLNDPPQMDTTPTYILENMPDLLNLS